MTEKRGVFELSFSWIFAILVGAVIIFLAIYAATRLITTQEYTIDTETAKQLTIIFDPLETGLASGKSSSATFNSDTKIYDKCSSEGLFGNQRISLSGKSIGGRWSKPSAEVQVTNKYIFSDSEETGKMIFFFSKPFEFPFKVSEIIFMSGKKYCFVEPPEFIYEEISNLKLKNAYVSNGSCGGNIKVCFNNEECEINVVGSCSGYQCENDFDFGNVIKNGKTSYYYKSLIYAAIFSDNNIYECNVKRLMKRASQLAYLYYDESNFLVSKGCGSDISSDLLAFANSAGSLKSSGELILLLEQVKLLETRNSALTCNLW